MGVPSQPLPTIGQPNSTEDAKVRSALSELQTILTGAVDATNIADSAITTAKILDGTIAPVDLSTAALNTFVKSQGGVDRRLQAGRVVTGGFNGGDQITVQTDHNMGATPTIVIGMAEGLPASNGFTSVDCALYAKDATTITFVVRLGSGVAAIGTVVNWIAFA